MKPLQISEPASLELVEAIRWYEERRPGWGAKLFDPVSQRRTRGCHGRLFSAPRRCYRRRMTLKARVKAGRLVVDEPTDLPEGTVVELLPLDPGDWLDETDRAALHQALRDSHEDLKAGRLIDADVVLSQLRSR